MSDRLKDLQRQRALVQQQQEWLDREIDREMGAAPQPAATPVVPAQAESHAVEADADKLIEQYSQGQRPIRDQVKNGCLVYFFAAFAVVGLVVALLYLFRSGR